MSEPAHISIGAVATHLGVSVSQVRKLADAGTLPFVRTAGGHRRFVLADVVEAWQARTSTRTLGHAGATALHEPPGAPTINRAVALDGLQEDAVWSDARSGLSLGTNAAAIVAHGFTEMLNNAIDHSKGTQARIRVWDGQVVRVEIVDDGIGAFASIAAGFDLPDLTSAILELTKGGRTTDPARHAGEGIFFTSKAVDRFCIEANGLSWIVDNNRGDHAVGASSIEIGTRVSFAVRTDTERRMRDVFEAYSEDFEFVRSSPVVTLAAIGTEFDSRSEAKRLLAGMERFRHIDVDFHEVDAVGQGFVDELFRVWPTANPETTIKPINMNEAVEFMVRRGLPPHPDPF
jgi:excisionase family DNA binding protein